jgi:hypothetical protein
LTLGLFHGGLDTLAIDLWREFISWAVDLSLNCLSRISPEKGQMRSEEQYFSFSKREGIKPLAFDD